MRSKLFEEKPKTAKTSAERWVRVMPDNGDGYHLYDLLNAAAIGRIWFDAADNWIYDGNALTVEEQEDLAGFISGHHKEMDKLVSRL